MIDIKELRRLAQAATPGPWKMLPVGDGRQKFAVANSEFLSILTVTDEGGATFGTVYDDADARFIAAANPATVIELLDRLEAAEKSDAESIAMYRNARDERDWNVERLEDAIEELTALRAKIEAMEKQEPTPSGQKALLLNAAPDLLEALRGMFAMWRSVCRAQGWEPEHLAEAVRAQAAITKATGEQP